MRLFVGVELDDPVRRAASSIAESLKRDLGSRVDARWVPAANLHITLWFLGEVHDSRVEATLDVLAQPVEQPAFDLELSGLGAFPPAGAPRVFWIGVSRGGDSLVRLNAALTARLEPLGFRAERRPYSAHLTIARVKDVSRGVSYRDLRAQLTGRSAEAGGCRIDAVTVFRSHTSPKGATYEALHRLRLQ